MIIKHEEARRNVELLGGQPGARQTPSGLEFYKWEDDGHTAVLRDLETGEFEVWGLAPGFAGYAVIIDGDEFEFLRSDYDESRMESTQKKQWMQKAFGEKNKGNLHKRLGISPDKKIPDAKLKAIDKAEIGSSAAGLEKITAHDKKMAGLALRGRKEDREETRMTEKDIRRAIAQDGRPFELRKAYDNYELWLGNDRLESGSLKDVHQTWIKNRFKRPREEGRAIASLVANTANSMNRELSKSEIQKIAKTIDNLPGDLTAADLTKAIRAEIREIKPKEESRRSRLEGKYYKESVKELLPIAAMLEEVFAITDLAFLATRIDPTTDAKWLGEMAPPYSGRKSDWHKFITTDGRYRLYIQDTQSFNYLLVTQGHYSRGTSAKEFEADWEELQETTGRRDSSEIRK